MSFSPHPSYCPLVQSTKSSISFLQTLPREGEGRAEISPALLDDLTVEQWVWLTCTAITWGWDTVIILQINTKYTVIKIIFSLTFHKHPTPVNLLCTFFCKEACFSKLTKNISFQFRHCDHLRVLCHRCIVFCVCTWYFYNPKTFKGLKIDVVSYKRLQALHQVGLIYVLLACVLFLQPLKFSLRTKQQITLGLGRPRTGPYAEKKVNEHLKNTESDIFNCNTCWSSLFLPYLMKGTAF